MWNMETEMIPVVIGALGVIKKGLEKYVDRIRGISGISELQKKHSSGNKQSTSSERFCKSSRLFGALGPGFGLGALETKQPSQGLQ